MPTELEKDAILGDIERTFLAKERRRDERICPLCQGHRRKEPIPHPTSARGPP